MQEVKLQVRLEPPLHERLVEAARQNRRSLNSEILARLESSFSSLSAWHQTFPNAAASIAEEETRRTAKEQAWRQQMRLHQLQMARGSAEAQLASIEGLAMTIHEQLLRRLDAIHSSAQSSPQLEVAQSEASQMRARLEELDSRQRQIRAELDSLTQEVEEIQKTNGATQLG
jgi:hypothetical protein